MSFEIERRFLVKKLDLSRAVKKEDITQGFLSTNLEKVIRIRIVRDLCSKIIRDHAYLTVKGKTVGSSRREIETPINVPEAKELLKYFSVGNLLIKTRYSIPIDDVIWEVDVFKESYTGLIIAEVELKSEDQKIIIPDWVGEEITSDFRYANSNLCQISWLPKGFNQEMLSDIESLM